MAEAQLRKTQFTYNANANLVLQTDHTVRRDLDGPTGEPESLSENYSSNELMKQMGSRIIHSKPRKPSEEVLKKRKQKWKEDQQIKKLTKIRPNDDAQNVEVFPYYQPTISSTKTIFGKFLNILERVMGGQPRNLMRNLAHNCLCILKDEKKTIPEKQRNEINKMLPSHHQIDTETFSDLISLSKQITDFDSEMNTNPDDVVADEPQVGVIIEDDHPINDIMADLSDNPDSSSGEETAFKVKSMPQDFQEREKQRQSQINLELTYDQEEMNYNEEEFEVNPKDIHAHWLLGKIGEYINDATMKKKKEIEIFDILEKNSRTLENDLLECLGPKLFSFAQFLMRNKDIIIWCTKLKRVSGEEYEQLIIEMNKTPKLARIYQELCKTHGTLDAKQKKATRDQYTAMQKLKKRNIDSNLNEITQDLSEHARWFSEKSKTSIELETLEFRNGGHFISNSDWKLRKGAKYINKKGYQEIFVPAIQSIPKNHKLISISELPKWTHAVFKTKATEDDPDNKDEIKVLNHIQTKCYNCAFKTSQNMLVCAPTGAGKTNIALMAILREIGIHRENGQINLDDFKVVYIAPMKSLVREIVVKFNKRLNSFGINVMELSGDTQLTRDQLHQTQMIVSTPEKWDIVTRKGMDRSYTSLVKLIIIDEIHMLHDERGPIIEAIIARTIRHVETTKDFIRLVALSATLPNYEDVATFLRVDSKSGLFYFDESYRPCPLIQRFGGITYKKPIKQYQLLNKLCYEYCKEQFMRQNQVIIFVHSRKETYNTAKDIIEKAKKNNNLDKILPPSSHSFDILKEETENCNSDLLKELLPYGIGIHHAGLNRDDRSLIEDLFADEHIRILVSTATLAYGINLPAHSVIVKGTQVYNPQKGKWVEISMQDVMQMFGRSGRPGFDTSGEAYLITTYQELQYYLPLLNEQLPIESQMISRLSDTLNAEIVLGTVTNLKEATLWLAYTYLFVRMLKVPETYHIKSNDQVDDEELEQRRIDLAHTTALILDKSNLIQYDKKSGSFQVTELGRICAYYYLTYSTIQTFNEHLKPTMSDIELFRVFSLADEFKYMGRNSHNIQIELPIL
jgi:pre-mRNA-splicing helicase BRR2